MERRKGSSLSDLLGALGTVGGADVEEEPVCSRPVSGGVFGH